MTKKDDSFFIEHILESIIAVESFSKDMKKEELSENRLKQSAIIREIEIIGEATKNISKTLKDKHDNIKWKEISGTRDKIIHHYFVIDFNIIWEIIKNGLPKLKKQILEIKKDLKLVA